MAAGFDIFPLLSSLQQALTQLALHTPTEIQHKAIPALLGGKSIVAVAETGSGKTLSYVLPILDRVKNTRS